MSDRPGSAAQSVQSHQTSSTGTGARGGAPPPVAMNEISGADPYDRYKLMFTGMWKLNHWFERKQMGRG